MLLFNEIKAIIIKNINLYGFLNQIELLNMCRNLCIDSTCEEIMIKSYIFNNDIILSEYDNNIYLNGQHGIETNIKISNYFIYKNILYNVTCGGMNDEYYIYIEMIIDVNKDVLN